MKKSICLVCVAALCASCSYINMESRMDGRVGAKEDQQENSGQSKAWQNDQMPVQEDQKKVDDKNSEKKDEKDQVQKENQKP